MNLIGLSIQRPTAVIAAVIMVVLFGWVALQRIPIQMAPDVRQPVINVSTSWPGAAPAEVEREIINRQEEVLKGLEGVRSMSSVARNNRGSVTLEFGPGQNMDRALLLVANRLDRVSGYPNEASEPSLGTSGTEDNAIAWFSLTRAPGNERPMVTYGDFLEDVVQERLGRVKGVDGVSIFGDTEREMRIVVDAAQLARYSLTVSDVVNRLRQGNASISGGDVAEGKRRYVVRTEGDYTSVNQVEAVILRSDGSDDGALGRVTVGDIAEVTLAFKKSRAEIRQNGEPAMAFNMTRDQGANVIETMAGIRAAIQELADGPMADVGLVVNQMYDETIYVKSAIFLVQQNIFVGGLLAAIVLMLFLRSWRATLVVTMAIPVSVIGTFVAMAALGRSLNVISLAGIAFAVGMVVDAAIVVLENIFRLRQEGYSRQEAAFKGASQVWPAVLVSALTTVMVFIPILVMQLEAGQLFRDIGVAISVSVMLSLLVSVTLVPAMANRLFIKDMTYGSARIPGIDHFGHGFRVFWQWFAKLVVRRKFVALVVVGAVTGVAVLSTVEFLPKRSYLPTGNQNFVFGFVQPPAGYNLETTASITRRIEESTRPYWSPEAAGERPDGLELERFFYVALEGRAFIGGKAVDPTRVRDLIPVISGPAFSEPGTFAFVFQPSIFGRSIGGGNAIDLDISGPDLETLATMGQRVFSRLQQALPAAEGHRIRPVPAHTLGAPEVRILPDRTRLADNGLSVQALGQAIDAFNDGVRIAEITVDGKRIDLTLAGPLAGQSQTQAIGELPVVTADGRIVPVNNLADVVLTSGPTEIRRIERARTVTMRITPSDTIPLETAIDIIRSQVVDPLVEEGLPAGVRFNISGTADKLLQTWNELVVDLALALVIVYLVMAVLFESFVYPLIILLSVPLAAAGGIGGLALLNTQVNQPLDMLTMLGFVILVGIVVNNAILLVHQTLYHIRVEGADVEEAISLATQNRVRPIFMSTLTSVFGMLPLVIFPGAGSELYRGLGSVVLGGLAVSAVLTMAVVPPMMSLTVGFLERGGRNSGARGPQPAASKGA
ncbi:MAG: efflux RND transporter permease subunit [Alphaproteobacteria bacterium]